VSDQVLSDEEKRGQIVDMADSIFATHRGPLAALIGEVVVIFIVEKRTPRIFVGDLADGVKAALVNALAAPNKLGRGVCPEVTFTAEVVYPDPRQWEITAAIGGQTVAIARIAA